MAVLAVGAIALLVPIAVRDLTRGGDCLDRTNALRSAYERDPPDGQRHVDIETSLDAALIHCSRSRNQEAFTALNRALMLCRLNNACRQ